ncbi:uncharacterized protein LOC119093368 [Pollicipes pollicipes]|uniref:uncharacterized protein LOC119093368 n=1 Tax=Pollicipes pollicipes TaxID=41117 RepID=UPI0018857B8A|nr:uncharacterized protein LOC119093368 [Pollicipes pollicipes]
MREYRQTLGQAQRDAGQAQPDGDAAAEVRSAELADVRHQLAKYKKYAKELKKTKENLLSTVQTMEDTHAAELKALREEHETQLSQVLAQVTSETEILGTFRADAEAVQLCLAQRAQENAELRRALAERDAEVERLAALNQSLHDLAVRQLQQLASAELPALGPLVSKLQSLPRLSEQLTGLQEGASLASQALSA